MQDLRDIADVKRAQDKILARWASRLEVVQGAGLRRARARASGDLEKSLNTQVKPSDAALRGVVVFSFLRYGRFIDMKRLDRRRQLPTDEIEAWIRAKGVEKFKRRFRKLKGSTEGIPRAQLINMIAWGIVKGRQKNMKHKRKRWYNKRKDAMIYELRDELTELYIEAGVETITAALKSKG